MTHRIRRKTRGLEFESLEQRSLLAGLVTVQVLNGDLIIRGDDRSNGLTIEQLGQTFDPAGGLAPGNSFRITPDKTTTISYQGVRSREAIIVADVDRDGRADLAGGDDDLAILGASSPLPAFSSLSVNTGGGADRLRMANLSLAENLIVESPNGVDQIAIESTSARAIDMFIKLSPIKGEAARIDKSTPILMRKLDSGRLAVTVDGLPASIQLEESTIREHVDMSLKTTPELRKYIDKTSPLLLRGVQAGDIAVRVEELPTEITVQETSARSTDMFIKLSPIKGEAARIDKSTPILMQKLDSERLAITVDGLPASIQLENSTIREDVDLYYKSTPELRKYIDKTSPLLLRGVQAGDIAIRVEELPTEITLQDSTSARAVDMFIKLSPIKGEAARIDKSTPILMQKLDSGRLAVTVDGLPASIQLEDSTFREDVVVYYKATPELRKYIDKTSPLLLRGVQAGDIAIRVEELPTEITLQETSARSTDMFIKLSPIKGEAARIDKSTPILMQKLDSERLAITVDGLPASIQLEDSTVREDVVVYYKSTPELRKYIDKTSPLLLRGVQAGDIAIRVEELPTEITLQDSTSARAVDMFIKMSPIKGEAARIDKSTPILMQKLDSGRLAVTVDGLPASIQLEDSTVREDVVVYYKATPELRKYIDKTSPLLLRGVQAGDIAIRVEELPTEITLQDSTSARAVDMFIKMSPIKGEATRIDKSTPILMQKLDSGRLAVTVDGLPASIQLEDSTVREDVVVYYKSTPELRKYIDKTSPLLLRGVQAGDIAIRVEELPTEITLQETSARSTDMFIKLSPIKGEAARIDKSTPILMQKLDSGRLAVTVDGLPASIQLEDSTFREDVVVYYKATPELRKYIDKTSPLLLRGVQAGDIAIRVEELPTEITLQDSTSARAVDMFIKMSPIKGEAARFDKSTPILMRKLSSESLAVTVDGLPASIQLENSTIREDVDLYYKSTPELRKYIDKTSPLLLRGVQAGDIAIRVEELPTEITLQDSTSARAVDMFIKLSPIKGEAARIDKSTPILMQKLDSGRLAVTVDGLPASIQLEDSTVREDVVVYYKATPELRKYIDKTSPLLLRGVQAGDIAIRVEELPTEITLQDSTSARAVDMFIKMSPIKGEATRIDKSTPILMQKLDSGRLAVTVDGLPASIQLEDSTIREHVDMSLKSTPELRKYIDKTSPLLLRGVQAGDIAIRVEELPTKITLQDSTSARAVDMFIKMSPIKGEAARIDKSTPILLRSFTTDRIHVGLDNVLARISLEDVQVQNGRLHTNRALDLDVSRLRASGFAVRSENDRGENSHVRLHDSVFVGDLSLITGSGDDAIELDSVAVSGAIHVETGDGDDHLLIGNSEFGGPATLDGGPGMDTLQIVDSLFGGTLETLNWEEIL